MTDLDVLEELQRLFGGSIHRVNQRREHWKQSWRWNIYGEPAARVMESVRPYVFERRRAAIDAALSVWYTRIANKEKRKDLIDSAGRAYLNGEGSLREIGRRFGVSYEAVRKSAEALI